MAVYTVLDRQDIEAFIAPYGIGPLLDFEGVADGIENSNYFITTDQSDFPSEVRTSPQGRYVLTLFESAQIEDLRFYVDLTTQLSNQGLPVPCPVRDADGEAVQQLLSKPAVLVPRIPGRHPSAATPVQLQALGTTLGHIHLASLGWNRSHPSTRSLEWVAATAERIAPLMSEPDRNMLSQQLSRFQQAVAASTHLPRAVIHGDIFRDNVLFEGDTITAIIDFNSAGDGYLLFDLAVVINDWCSRPDGSLDTALTGALVNAYQAVRPLTADETALWNDFLQIAALRFWVSRLASQLLPQPDQRSGSLVEFKDPQAFRTILVQRIQSPSSPG